MRDDLTQAFKDTFFQKYVPGNLTQEIIDHASFTGGKVVITGVNLTTTMRDDLTQAFKDTFGDKTQIVFEGNISGVSQNDVLNTAKVNELADNHVLNDVIFVDRALEGEGQSVVIGNAGVKNSTGFTSVNNAKDVTITDGKNLVLIGSKEANFSMSDAIVTASGDGVKNSTGFTSVNNAKDVTITDGKNLVLIGSKEANFSMSDAIVTASGDASKLTLGTLGLADGADYQGSLNEVILRGGAGLDVVNGSYTIDDILARTNTTQISVQKPASLTSGAITLTSVILRGGAGLDVVNGSYTIDDILARTNTTQISVQKPASLTSGAITLTSGSRLLNQGNLHVTGSLNGTENAFVQNAENATMTVDGITSLIGTLRNDGTLTARDEVSVNGTLTNNGEATIGFFKVLGKVNNTGTINTSETSFVNGQLTNTGTIKLYNTTNIDKFSELTNVKDLTAEGTVTMNGQLGNLSNADFETLKVAGTGSEFTNHGTLVIDELTLTDGAYAINGGAMKDKYAVFGLFRARPTEQIRDLNVGQGTQKTNAGLGYYAQGTIDGIFTNTKDGETFFGTSDVHVDGQGIAIGTNGQVQNAGTITFGGSLVNAGSIAGDGKIIFKHEGASTNVFSNSGTINVGSLEANDITYEHTGGSIASANGWFENSQINVKGGEMSHASLGTGNTYTVGLTGTQNQVATLTIDKVTSDSEVNIIEGGKFVAKEIALTEDKKTVHLSGGTLSTTLNQIFDDVFYKALDIDAENPDDQVDIEGVKVATGVSGVIDSIKKGIEFGWGTVAFDDASYSASMAADVLQKLDEVDTDPQGVSGVIDSIKKGIEFGWGTVAFDDASYSASMAADVLQKLDEVDTDPQSHEGQLEVAFNGKAAQSFNVDLANSVVAKDPEGQKTYATFANEELTNEVAASNGYKALYVGHEDTDSAITQPLNKDFNKLHTSIGFKGVRNVSEGLYIGDGYHLVLVGEDSNSVDANKYELADGAVYVTGGSKGNALGDPSTLTLGSYGTANKTAGHLSQLYVGVSVNDLSNAQSNGQVRVRHGDFTIDTLTNGGVVLIGGDGKNGLREDREASLTVKNYVDNGYYTLDGQLTTNYANFNIEKLSMGAGKGQGSLVNRGTMSIKEGTYNGLIDNHGTLTAGNLTIQNGAVGGQVGNFALVNNTDAKMVADNLTIAGDGTWGSGADMRGNLTIQNGAVGGQVGNFALVNNTDAKMVADNLTIAGDGTWGSGADMRGGMTNAGTLTVNENMTVEGTFDNKGSLTANVFTVNDGGDVNNLASGSMTIDALAFNGGAFDNAGTVNLVQSKGNSTIASAFNNTGKLTVAEGDNSLNIAANGSITNDGTIDAKGKVSVVGGTLTNNKTATFDDLDITSGQVIVNAGSSFKDTGTTSVNMANKSDVAIDNKSDLELSDLDLNKGTISGGTMHVADANVATDGVIEQVMGFFEKLVNAGTVNLTGGDVNGLNNTGTLTSSGDITLAGTSSGSITVDGTLGIEQNETLTSTGTLIANSNSSISGTLEAHGQSTLKGDTTVADGGKLSANGTFNAATVNVNQGGLLASAGTSNIDHVNAQANSTINVDGGLLHLGANGTFNAATVNVNQGGLLASAGTSNIDHVNAQANSTINVDGGLLHLGELHASNVTYNQTDGTITSDKGWFTDSTLNISGGHLDANQIKDETGKVTGSLGHNTVNISGRNPMPSINDEDTPENKSHWKDNLTVVNADVVTSDTTININAGGVLDVEDLQLTAPDSITVAGGGLQTSLDEIFDWVKTEVIKIDAEDPDSGVIELPTDVLVSTTVGDVQDSIKEGINFESGMIAFDDEHFSYSTLISAGQQFGEAFADSNVTLHFLGNMAEKFTIDTADKLIAEGLPEVLHGIVLDTTTLHNTSLATGDTNKNLVIGGTADGANSIGINMGFKDVANADNITIEGGKEFALVGNQRPQDFDWTTGYDDSNKLLVDAADGGSVTINNGTFTMGSDGVRNPTIGWVNSTDIGANGTLVVKNGEFADWTINNAGTINVNKNGTLHTNELTNTNKVNVAGSLTVENLNNANGTITNIGSILVSGTNDLNGTINNGGTFEALGQVTISGNYTSNLNNANGTITNIGSILVSGTNDLNGTINNGGTFEALGQVTISGNYTSDKNGKNIFEDLTVSGVLANAGDLTIKGNEGVSDDEFKLTIAQGGKLENAGTINNTHHDTKVEGELINGGKAYYDDMTIVAGGISNNLGYEKGDILTVDKDGKHTNSGVSIWNTVDVSGVMDNLAQGEGHGLVIGSEDSKGNLTIAQGGTLNNGSQLDATHVENTKVEGLLTDATHVENTKVEGLLTNTDKGVANYDDMTIVAGGVSNNAGFEKGDILTVDKDGKHTNSGVSIWNTVDVSGVMDNLAQGENQGLIIGSEDSKGNLTIAQGGSFNNGSQLDATNVENTKVEGLLNNTKRVTFLPLIRTVSIRTLVSLFGIRLTFLA